MHTISSLQNATIVSNRFLFHHQLEKWLKIFIMENTIIKETKPAKDQQADGQSLEEKFSHIKGWGMDADPENEPTYPMKKYTGDDHQRLNYTPPQQQPVDIEVLKSNERPRMTAVFGTSTPPSGVSGAIRRFAFKYSEGSA